MIMAIEDAIFKRSELLLGSEAMQRLAAKKVIIFGVGGVGSWCAESLIRTGIRHLTIVDSDRVCESNINRQLMATTQTVGQVKVDALRERLLSINPSADIITVEKVFNEESADTFDLDSYDYIIDAIDSLKDKALLILLATKSKAKFFSSMGAALKIDPTRIRVTEFWNVKGDPLARMLRKRFKSLSKREKSDVYISSSEREETRPKVKQNNQYPKRKFQCVYSDELLQNQGPQPQEKEETLSQITKGQTNGSLAHITAIFGFTLAGLVLQDAIEKAAE